MASESHALTITSQTLRFENWPPPALARSLSPNGRVFWATRHRAVQSVHKRVWLTARIQGLRPISRLVYIYPEFTFPERRARDMDNWSTGVMKAVLDALVRGRYLVADDSEHVRLMPVELRVEPGRRALELRFEGEAH